MSRSATFGTAARIARTLLLPAGLRHLALLREAAVPELIAETEGLVGEFVTATKALEVVNKKENQEDDPPARWAEFIPDNVIPAMDRVREVADRLEKIVADDLWPLPKHSEALMAGLPISGPGAWMPACCGCGCSGPHRR